MTTLPPITMPPDGPASAAMSRADLGALIAELNQARRALAPGDHAGVVRLIASLRSAVEALSGEWDYHEVSAVYGLVRAIGDPLGDRMDVLYPWKTESEETPE